MNELTKLEIKPVEYKRGTVTFNQYQEILDQAKLLAQYVSNVEVTDENVKYTKKMLAEINKKVKELEDNRITIKKEMLKPYQEFESQIKEIVSVVKDADSIVRQQVKDLEEHERAEKRKQIEQLFENRVKHYEDVDQFLTVDHFLTPQHLNKSVTMNKVESEMVEWLEQRKKDFKVLYNQDHVSDLLETYLDTLDVAETLDIQHQKLQKREELKQIIDEKEQKSGRQEVKKRYIIELHNQKDFDFAQMLMDKHNIEYSVKEVN